jgi:hypothetical protein
MPIRTDRAVRSPRRIFTLEICTLEIRALETCTLKT